MSYGHYTNMVVKNIRHKKVSVEILEELGVKQNVMYFKKNLKPK